MGKNIKLVALAVLLSASILFASNLVPAYATTYNTVTLPSGAVGVDTQMFTDGDTNITWWTATLGGALWLYQKPNNIYTPSQSIQLSGASGGQMTLDTYRDNLIVFTSAGVYIFDIGTTALSLISFTSNSGYTGVNDAVYDSNRDRVYAVKISVSPPAIFDMAPLNPNSVTTWSNTNMGGYNAFIAAPTGDLAIDADSGKLFVNASVDGTHTTVVMIDHLTSTWNETKTAGSILGNIYGIATDPQFNWVVATISDGSAYKKFDSAVIGNANMTLLATVSTSTIPRYIDIEPTSHIGFIGRSAANNVTIFDNTADTIISTAAVCTNPIGHIDSKIVDANTLTPTVYASLSCGTNNLQTLVIYGAGAVETPGTTGGGAVDGYCPAGSTVRTCVGDRSLMNTITGAPSVASAGNNIFGMIGLVNSTNTDIKENGTGLLLMLILGTFFACAVLGTVATANSKFGAGIAYTEIPKEFWLFLVVGTVAIAFFLQWIPDIVFYGMVVGLAGLFSFGLYKHVRG